MTRYEIEKKLWADQYHWGMIESKDRSIAGEVADAAVEQFRRRYPAEPAAPAPVWHDDPPHPKDGNYHPCWVQGTTGVRIIYWSVLANEWKCYDPIQGGLTPLAGRRVSPIVKPQEPTT